ncbi:regulatory protein MarR [Tamlana nanhaiensis]|uniref:Regulatory protein MarR n=1 Tax=Neotamlana nanhaiensis TaxID=1382798 RepID=A0A0D7W5H8_9FLAO|nr:SatD family protein [Tamlana nanhaiensis]KJD34279.1 regulatory protein MarR [Tamlana nanhaiensis]
MIAILTGDIINSRETEPKVWLNSLKDALNYFGNTPKTWEIFRGDSFQLEVKPEDALFASILLKSTIKQYKNIDVRLAIGLGEKTFETDNITESNGAAFINSGECFESLKKNTLAIKSSFDDFDLTLNLMFELAQLTINNWTTISSTIIKTTLLNPDLNQNQLAKLLSKSQSNISEGLKRGGFDEILKLMHFYKQKISTL